MHLRTLLLHICWATLLSSSLLAEAATRRAPDWVRRPYDAEYPRERYVVGVGHVEANRDKAEARNQAMALARDNVAQQILTKVISETEEDTVSRISGRKESTRSDFHQSVRTRTNLELSHCRVVEVVEEKRFGKKDLFHARAVLDKNEAAESLSAQLRLKSGRFQAELQQAGTYLRGDRPQVRAALESLLHARRSCWDAIAVEALLATLRPGSLPVASDLSPAKVDALLTSVVDGLSLSVSSGSDQPVAAGRAPERPLVCRLTWKGEKNPVAGFPVRYEFLSGAGRLAPGVRTRGIGGTVRVSSELDAVTDVQGLATADIDSLQWAEGTGLARVSVSLRPEPLLRSIEAPFREQAEAWIHGLRDKTCLFKLRPPTTQELDFEAWVGTLVRQVVGHSSFRTPQGLLVGAFTYRDVPAGGPFGEKLRDAIIRELGKQGKNVRLTDEGRRLPQLSGTYRDDPNQVKVRLRFENAGSASLFVEEQALLRQRAPTQEFAPADLERIHEYLTQSALIAGPAPVGGLKLEVWTNHGNRPVFRVGQLLEVFVKPSRDCYVHLVYTDAGDDSYYLLPNAATGRRAQVLIKKDQVRRFPDPKLGEDFLFQFSPDVVGMEALKILASTAELASPVPASAYPVYAEAGFLIRKGRLRAEQVRGILTRGPNVELAVEETREAICTIQVQR